MVLDKTIYIGPFVQCRTPTELEIVENAAIGVDEHGKIAFVQRNTTQPSPGSGWEHAKIVSTKTKHAFFFPGFIDTHTHAAQYPNAGLFGSTTLLDWLETYTFPMEGSFSDLQHAKRIYRRVVDRTLSHGTTTACYYATIHVPATNALAEICLEKRQRAFVGRVCMDRMSPEYYRDESPEASLAGARQVIEFVKQLDPGGALVRPIITPRFAPSCSRESLALLGKLREETDVAVQTHVSENQQECAFVKELFPHCEHYTGVYEEAGLLGSKTILAHACHLLPAERALLKARETKISHCPASNTALTSGTCPVRELIDEGLTLGLGTDVSGGYTPSILAEAREAIFVSRHVAMHKGDHAKLSVAEALYLATRGGAAVVGLSEQIGGFEVGMDWDAQMICLADVADAECLDEDAGLVEIFGRESWEDKVAKWLYTGDDRNTQAVWVKGRLVHCRKSFTP